MSEEALLDLQHELDEVVVEGFFLRTVLYLLCAVTIAAGPGLLIALSLAGELSWQGIVGGVVLCALGLAGVFWAAATARHRRSYRKMTVNGLPAVARVTSSSPRAYGEDNNGVELNLVIEGAEIPVFRATRHMLATLSTPKVGDTFDVLVDPIHRTYLVP